MKALLELASLFQVIPKASQAPWQGGRGGQREWEKRPLSTPFQLCVATSEAADGCGNAHRLNTNRNPASPSSLVGQAAVGPVE